MLFRSRHDVSGFQYDERHNPWAGWVSMLIAGVISIWLFSNQAFYTGPVPSAVANVGDITFEVGFIIAFVLFLIFARMQKEPVDEGTIIPSAGL